MKEVLDYGTYTIPIDLSIVSAWRAVKRFRDTTEEWPDRLVVSPANEQYGEGIVQLLKPICEQIMLVIDYRLTEWAWEVRSVETEGFGSEGA